MSGDPWADEQYDRAESWRSVVDDVPEPDELTDWAERAAAVREARERRRAALCATCGKRRSDYVHLYVLSLAAPRCVFVEPHTKD